MSRWPQPGASGAMRALACAALAGCAEPEARPPAGAALRSGAPLAAQQATAGRSGGGPAELCWIEGDEDDDGRADCRDDDCWGAGCAEDCARGGDEDRDGLADCEDSDCALGCVEDCADGRDNDLDGAADCADVDCGLHLSCWSDLQISTRGGADLRVARQSAEGSWSWSRDSSSAVVIDALVVSGEGLDRAGRPVPCGLEARELRAFAAHHAIETAWMPSTSWSSVGVWAAAITPRTDRCPTPTSAQLDGLVIELGVVLPHMLRAPGDALGISRIGLRLGGDGGWTLAPTSVELAPVQSAAWWRGSGFVSGSAALYMVDRGWTQSQQARAGAMRSLDP